jgi:hypothetical protein
MKYIESVWKEKCEYFDKHGFPKNYKAFNKIMSKFEMYGWMKRQWQDLHPSATPQEYEEAIRRIAKQLGI